MGFVSCLEEIVDRHIEAMFETNASIDYVRTPADAKALFTPLLDSIRSALAQPEAEHVNRAERASWDRNRAEYDRALSDRKLHECEVHRDSLCKENVCLSGQIAGLEAERNGLKQQLHRQEVEARKEVVSLRKEIDQLGRRSVRLEGVVARMQGVLEAKEREVAVLRQAAMQAQVSTKY